jgi:arylsulfatase A-like enzyme
VSWLLWAHSSFAAERRTRPPNIVFILADDLGVNDLACYGRKEHHTPHLDQLAADGMRFTSAYCAQPICSPSRAAILTGRTPARLHLTTYLPGRPDCVSQSLLHPHIEQKLPLAERTLAEHLRERGYATACIGKWHLGEAGFLPTDQGFDVYHPGRAVTQPSATEGGKGEYDLTAAAERFVEANRERPFFLYLCHNSPHINYSARPEFVARNSGAFEPVYAALIETLDDTVGRLLKRIDTLGLTTNTLVVFTSDNGGLHVPEAGHSRITHNAPFRAGKGFLYEGGLRIPLIVRWRGHVPGGRIVDTPVINTDWLPTLLELADSPTGGSARRPKPSGDRSTVLDGRSFAPLLSDGPPSPLRPLFWHFPHYTNQGSQPAGAARMGDWKLIEHYEDGGCELFNLRRDPGEAHDLASAEPRRVAHFKRLLANWRASVGAQTNVSNPAFDAGWHRRLYEDFEPGRFNPAAADAAAWSKAQSWRKQMDAVPPVTGR